MSVMLVLGLSVAAIAPAQAATISVSVGGDIQAAINKANPGDTIVLASGTYKRDFYTVRNGTSSAPIRITGPRDAVLKGAGSSRIAQVHHDFITLDGFTIDGLHGSSTSASGYRDKLIYAVGKVAGDGVKNLRINNMLLKNAGGECIRIKYLAENNVVENSTITNCGVYDFKFGGTGKNGEGIYIGTAPEQTSLNPSNVRDVSKNNVVRNNTFDTQGNECVDIKEGSTANVVSGNSCTGQKDPKSAGLDSRGSGNTFEGNTIYSNLGAGVRLGGDLSTDGTNNNVRNNIFKNNSVGGIKFMADPQGEVCGNDFTSQSSPFVGTYGGKYAQKSCSTSTTTTTAPSTTSPTDACKTYHTEQHKRDYDAIQVGVSNTVINNTEAALHNKGCGGTTSATTEGPDTTTGYTSRQLLRCQTLHSRLHTYYKGTEAAGVDLDPLDAELHRVGC